MPDTALRAAVTDALDRRPVNDDGRSGAVLERRTLPDGTRVVVKRFDAQHDLVMQITGDETGREVALVLGGLLDGLPPTVVHPALGAWVDDGVGILVMRDLGDAVLSWRSVVGPAQTRVMLGAIADLHAAYAGRAPTSVETEGLVDLPTLLGLFEPTRLGPYVGETLVDLALRGWEYWPEVAPGEVGERVLALALDTTPLARACRDLPRTLLHGDLATVNMAYEADRPGCLTVIDWGMASVGPAEVDIGRLLAGCAHLFGPVGPDPASSIVEQLDALMRLQHEVAGASYDVHAMRLGLLAGIAWLGWNKALDIVEHPDPSVRVREEAALSWWLRQAEMALEFGVVGEG